MTLRWGRKLACGLAFHRFEVMSFDSTVPSRDRSHARRRGDVNHALAVCRHCKCIVDHRIDKPDEERVPTPMPPAPASTSLRISSKPPIEEEFERARARVFGEPPAVRPSRARTSSARIITRAANESTPPCESGKTLIKPVVNRAIAVKQPTPRPSRYGRDPDVEDDEKAG